jgi:hypothetical protein
LLINAALVVLYLSGTQEGRKADKQIADFADYQLPEGSQLLQDLGFLAFTLDGVEMLQPVKKPRGGELTEQQKAANQVLARRRVRIEHAICGVKRCRMVKDRIRLYAGGIRDLVMEVAVGLHNLRLRFRPWTALA